MKARIQHIALSYGAKGISIIMLNCLGVDYERDRQDCLLI